MISNPVVLAALQADVKRLCVLVDCDWPSGPVYIHNRLGEKYWDNKVWHGIGEMGQISQLNAGGQSGEFNLTLNSADISLLNEANKDDAVGRAVKLYLAALDANRRIAGTDLIAYRFINSVGLKPGNVHQLNISCGAARMRRKTPQQVERLSAAAWRAVYPNDSYCDEVEALGKGPLSSYGGENAVGSDGGDSKRGGGRWQRR